MKKALLPLLGTISTFFLLASPATAGTVYVALASDMVLDGIRYETVLTVSNPSDQPRSFTTLFIEVFQDGTARDDGAGAAVAQTVPAGQTMMFTALSGGVPRGFLEITADPALVFSARLVPSVDGVKGVGGRVPVISSDNLIDGGERFYLQGLRRDSARDTTLGLINLSQNPNQCTVDLVGADGGARIQTAVLSLPPLAAGQWDDVLGLVGLGSESEVRAEIQCGGPAYAYGLVLDAVSGAVSSIDISQTGASLLAAPGQQVPCPEGAACFEYPGLVFTPTRGNEIRTLKMVLEEGSVYSAIKLRMTVDLTAWYPGDPGGIHNFFWLYRNLWAGNTFGYVNARGPNKNKISNLTNVNLPKGVTKTTRIDGALAPNQTYIIDYTYDTRSGRIDTLFLDQTGGVVASLKDSTSANAIRQEGEGFFIQLSLEGHFSEVPSYGWNYRDLRVDFLP
ncbi:MAG TPA: hypothetical protein VMV46_17205 [Thermoanaerobaculia bacterium]|nr:hypothetical protein [Thermoanaerobaculia bacterium]